MSFPRWLVAHFDDVDHQRLEPFVARYSPDITMRFGNAPVMTGHDQMRAGIGGFWDAIAGLRHNFGTAGEVDARTTVFEHTIDYTKKDGSVMTIPSTVIFEPEDDLVSDIRSYIDLGPVLS